MIKMLLVIGLIVVIVIAVAGVAMWYWMSKPLYEPGTVRMGKNLRAPLAPPEQTGDANFWQVEQDIQLYHFSLGQGKNVLIVHGGPGYPYIEPWPGLTPLADKYTFHYYDQRGCGQSTRPIDTFSSSNYYENMTTLDKALGLGAQIADIERIRQILGEDKLILIGHSFGGFIASLYAAEFPERVEALILIAPADVLVMPQQNGGLFESVKERLPDELKNDYDQWLKNYLDYQNIFAKSEADLVALNDEFVKYYAAVANVSLPEQGQAGGWMPHAIYMSMGLRHDYRSALKAVTAPVLVIHGANDLQTKAASRMYAEAFPNAQFHIIDSGHFSFYERPEEFGSVVGTFLSELK